MLFLQVLFLAYCKQEIRVDKPEKKMQNPRLNVLCNELMRRAWTEGLLNRSWVMFLQTNAWIPPHSPCLWVVFFCCFWVIPVSPGISLHRLDDREQLLIAIVLVAHKTELLAVSQKHEQEREGGHGMTASFSLSKTSSFLGCVIFFKEKKQDKLTTSATRHCTLLLLNLHHDWGNEFINPPSKPSNINSGLIPTLQIGSKWHIPSSFHCLEEKSEVFSC